MSTHTHSLPLPARIVPHGELVHELNMDPPKVGQEVYAYSRGRVRLVRVIKVTPTRVQVAYASPSHPGRRSAAPWFKRSDPNAGNPDAYPHLLHGIGTLLGLGAHPYGDTYGRTWTVIQPQGRGGHRLRNTDGSDA